MLVVVLAVQVLAPEIIVQVKAACLHQVLVLGHHVEIMAEAVTMVTRAIHTF